MSPVVGFWGVENVWIPLFVTSWSRCDICLSCSIFILHLCTSYCLLSYSCIHFFNSNTINISVQ
jgi:hypothetical protein